MHGATILAVQPTVAHAPPLQGLQLAVNNGDATAVSASHRLNRKSTKRPVRT